MQLKVENFIEILGTNSNDVKVKKILNTLKLQSPVLAKKKDTFWYELDDIGYDLAFIDESIVNNDEYADVGDGELIFVTAYFNNVNTIGLPFNIDKDDTYETIANKINKDEASSNLLFNRKSWFIKNDKNIEYALDFEFDDEYKKIEKVGISYSYGQLSK